NVADQHIPKPVQVAQDRLVADEYERIGRMLAQMVLPTVENADQVARLQMDVVGIGVVEDVEAHGTLIGVPDRLALRIANLLHAGPPAEADVRALRQVTNGPSHYTPGAI